MVFVWSSGWGRSSPSSATGVRRLRRRPGHGYGPPPGHGYGRTAGRRSCLRDLFLLNTGCCLAKPSAAARTPASRAGHRPAGPAQRDGRARHPARRPPGRRRPRLPAGDQPAAAAVLPVHAHLLGLRRRGARAARCPARILADRPPPGPLPPGRGRRRRPGAGGLTSAHHVRAAGRSHLASPGDAAAGRPASPPGATPAGGPPRWGGPPSSWPARGSSRTASRSSRTCGPGRRRFRLPLRGGGAVWLKSVGPGSAQEPVLAGALGGWVPGHVLVPLAVEPERRLLLLPDGGRTLRESGGAGLDGLGGDAAGVRAAAARPGPARRRPARPRRPRHPARAPARPRRRPARRRRRAARRPTRRAGPGRARPPAGRPATTYAGPAARLAGGGVPATLQHDDLHDANVFVADGRYRFFDWGDAVGLAPLPQPAGRAPHGGRGRWTCPPATRPCGRLRDAYLEPWRTHGTPRELRGQCDLALRVAPLRAGPHVAPHPARRAPGRAGRVGRQRARAGPPSTSSPARSPECPRERRPDCAHAGRGRRLR